MEESGVTNKQVGSDVEQSSWRQASSNFSSTTQCLFVKNITQQMVDDDVFPSLLTNGGYYGGRTLPSIVAG